MFGGILLFCISVLPTRSRVRDAHVPRQAAAALFPDDDLVRRRCDGVVFRLIAGKERKKNAFAYGYYTNAVYRQVCTCTATWTPVPVYCSYYNNCTRPLVRRNLGFRVRESSNWFFFRQYVGAYAGDKTKFLQRSVERRKSNVSRSS